MTRRRRRSSVSRKRDSTSSPRRPSAPSSSEGKTGRIRSAKRRPEKARCGRRTVGVIWAAVMPCTRTGGPEERSSVCASRSETALRSAPVSMTNSALRPFRSTSTPMRVRRFVSRRASASGGGAGLAASCAQAGAARRSPVWASRVRAARRLEMRRSDSGTRIGLRTRVNSRSAIDPQGGNWRLFAALNSPPSDGQPRGWACE